MVEILRWRSIDNMCEGLKSRDWHPGGRWFLFSELVLEYLSLWETHRVVNQLEGSLENVNHHLTPPNRGWYKTATVTEPTFSRAVYTTFMNLRNLNRPSNGPHSMGSKSDYSVDPIQLVVILNTWLKTDHVQPTCGSHGIYLLEWWMVI